MALATLSIDLEARIAKFAEGMDKAARLTEQQAAKIEAISERARGFGEALGVSIGTALSVAGFTQFIRNSADALDAMNDIKDATGASIENISGLEQVALRTGGTIEQVASILTKFNAVLAEAKPGSGTDEVLKSIGLNAEELRRLDPAEALQKTARALAGFADDANKARIIQDLFGKSVKEVAPFLADLAEQQRLLGTATSEQAAEAEKFNKQLALFQTNATNAGRAIATKLLPQINELLSKLNGNDPKGSILAGMGFNDRGLQLTNLAGKDAKLQEAKRYLEAVNSESLLSNVAPDYMRARREKAQRDVDAAQAEFDRAKFKLDEIGRIAQQDALMSGYVPRYSSEKPSLPDVSAFGSTKTPKASRAVKAAADPMDKYRDGLLARITEEWDQVGEAQRAALADLDAYIEKLGGEKDRATEQAMSRAQQYYEQAMTPAERLAAAQAEINKLWEQGAFVSDALATADQKRAAALAEISRQYEEQQDKLGALSDVAKSFSDVLMRAVENGDDLAKGLERIAMKALVFDPLSKGIEQMFSSLASAMTSSGGGAGPAGGGGVDLASLAIKVGSMFFGGFFAEGGEPPVGKVSVVGERGPELFIPKSAGSVVPNHALGGTTVQVVNHVTAGAQIGHADLAAAMAVTKQQTEASVLRMLRGRGVAV